MTTIPGTDNLIWSDEQTRFYLQLRIEERSKGNVRKQLVNDAGRNAIITQFYERYGERHAWKKFGSKFTSCKKQYDAVKKLTHNRTGLGYDSIGFIEMSDDWWEERYKEWPGARKIKDKPVANMDLMEEVYGAVHVSGAEGWSAQQGEDQLDDLMPEEPIHESDNVAESRQDEPSSTNAEAGVSQNVPSSSNAPRCTKRKRRAEATQAVADVIRDSIQSRDEILAHKNQLIESHPDISCSQLRAMRALHSLPSVRMWSPLYKASITHLKEDATNRQTFLSYEDDENKVKYLEFATNENKEW